MHALLTTITLATTLGSVYAQTLSNDQINKVKGNLASSATHSWEIGTRMEALLSLDTPSFSVLNSTVPPPKKAPNSLDDVLGSAKSVLSQAPTGNGPKPLFDNDSSAADPASTGIGILIANWTGQSGDYANAAENQIDYLLNKAPRAPNGAISHRASEAQLWSDFIYMVPPFLAYYGVTTSNQSMVHEAYNQIKLYRDQLRDSKAGNLWKHIVLGDNHDDDPGHWSTGNAWAAAGMMRVLGTIQHGPFAGSMKDEANDLENWAGEIHDGMFSHLQSSNLFLNYADADKSKSFEDAASTALIAASVYRLSLLSNQTIGKHLRQAEQIRQTLFKSDGSHVGSDGWLKPVVDPMNVGVQGEHSPEGQAFVLELHSAWRDWNATTGGQINASPLGATFSILSVTIVAASVVVLLVV